MEKVETGAGIVNRVALQLVNLDELLRHRVVVWILPEITKVVPADGHDLLSVELLPELGLGAWGVGPYLGAATRYDRPGPARDLVFTTARCISSNSRITTA